MSRIFQSAEGYVEFNKLVHKVETRMATSVPTALKYSQSSIARRITQRIVELGLVPFIQDYARHYGQSRSNSGSSFNFQISDFKICASTGAAKIGLNLLLKSVAVFFLHWVHVMVYAIGASFVRKTSSGAATLVFGVGDESLKINETDARFVEYCEHGPVEPLSRASRAIVQTALKIQPINPNRFEYARFPLFALMQEHALSFVAFFKFFHAHFRVVGAYLFAVIRCPLISILGRDFAYHAMLEHLNSANLIESIVITNSNYSAQPLWMTDLPGKRFQTHMVWYSQNTVPLVYADDPIESYLPNYRHVRVDVSWVWTAQYADYLRSLEVPGEIKVVGPILWQLPPVANIRRARKNEVVIVVFDVTPVTDERAEKIGLFRNYYNAANMSAFLRGVDRLKAMLEHDTHQRVRILLKHKRGFNSGHDHRYINFVEELVAKEKVELIPFNANIYELIAQADMVVVAPYSSPAYIADHLGIPSIFFDSSGELLPTYEKGQYINFASGSDELILLVKAAISA